MCKSIVTQTFAVVVGLRFKRADNIRPYDAQLKKWCIGKVCDNTLAQFHLHASHQRQQFVFALQKGAPLIGRFDISSTFQSCLRTLGVSLKLQFIALSTN